MYNDDYELDGAQDAPASHIPTSSDLSALVSPRFPTQEWDKQRQKYSTFWDWYTGKALNVTRRPKKRGGRPKKVFPLNVELVRTLSRKRASVLFGEAPDDNTPLVSTAVTPRLVKPEEPPTFDLSQFQEIFEALNPRPEPAPVVENEPQEEKKPSKKGAEEKEPTPPQPPQPPQPPFQRPKADLPKDIQLAPKMSIEEETAVMLQNLVNEVWRASGGRDLQQRGGVISQFLGGVVYEVKWTPDRDDLLIPISINMLSPDYFMPVWDSENYYDLLECFVVYKITAAEARLKYGVEVEETHAIYTEHWTRDSFKISVGASDGAKWEDKQENPFGFVPFVYIPCTRAASFWGESIVPDVRNLIKEFNARLADIGDGVKKNIHRRRFARNITKTPEAKLWDGDTEVIDLGTQPAHNKNAVPEVWTEEPANLPDGVVRFVDDLWRQILRESGLSPIAYGEDEGSQRSALTLAFRMWPATANARAQRTFWAEGLNEVAKKILRMAIIKKAHKAFKEAGIEVPEDALRKFSIHQDWHPMIPRDREQMVNEVTLRTQSNTLSPLTAMELLGDVRSPYVEFSRMAYFKLFMMAIGKASSGGGASAAPHQGSAPTAVESPIAMSGVQEKDN